MWCILEEVSKKLDCVLRKVAEEHSHVESKLSKGLDSDWYTPMKRVPAVIDDAALTQRTNRHN